MSKALWKSTNTSHVSSSLSILNKILSVILISAKNGMNCQNGRLIVIKFIIDKANWSLEDILIATLLHVFEDFRYDWQH